MWFRRSGDCATPCSPATDNAAQMGWSERLGGLPSREEQRNDWPSGRLKRALTITGMIAKVNGTSDRAIHPAREFPEAHRNVTRRKSAAVMCIYLCLSWEFLFDDSSHQSRSNTCDDSSFSLYFWRHAYPPCLRGNRSKGH